MKLFLDDERAVKDVTWIELPLGPWTVVKNYRQFVEYITNNGLPEVISFDHDLADEHYPWHEHNKYDYQAGKSAMRSIRKRPEWKPPNGLWRIVWTMPCLCPCATFIP